jgi:hypothetical protein
MNKILLVRDLPIVYEILDDIKENGGRFKLPSSDKLLEDMINLLLEKFPHKENISVFELSPTFFELIAPLALERVPTVKEYTQLGQDKTDKEKLDEEMKEKQQTRQYRKALKFLKSSEENQYKIDIEMWVDGISKETHIPFDKLYNAPYCDFLEIHNRIARNNILQKAHEADESNAKAQQQQAQKSGMERTQLL